MVFVCGSKGGVREAPSRAVFIALTLVSLLGHPGLLAARFPSTSDKSATTSANAIRLMPLGDSITQGQGGHGPSYRYHLWNRLTTAGYIVDFVGSSNQPFAAWRLGMTAQPFQPDKAAAVPAAVPAVLPLPFDDFDPDHEGHAGWKAEDLVANIDGWMRTEQPNIVLLHIGTNDLASGESVDSTLDEIGQLIDHMRAINPWIKIAVAQIIPCASPLCPAQAWADFNARLPALIAARNTVQSPLLVVDQNSGFDPSTDSYDGVHPNAAGDLKLARRWYPAVVALLGVPFANDTGRSIDDADARFVYTGTWARCAKACDPNAAGLYSGTLTVSSALNNVADITFTVGISGTPVRLYAVKNARAGIVAVAVDGAAESAIDLYSGSDFGYDRVWESAPLSIGSHRLRARVSGAKNVASAGISVAIDRITLLPVGSAALTQSLYLPSAALP